MSFRKASGQMYDFLSHTYNVIKGECPHDCTYCYMKIFPQGKIRLDTKALNINLGKNNFIFVGSSCDVFANGIPEEWINKLLDKCNLHDKNKYLFQSKNPARMLKFIDKIPKGSVIGTTIETNRIYRQMGNTLVPSRRASFMASLRERGFETMITIEPIMKFDLDKFVEILKIAQPTWINIGADSKEHNLPKPTKEEILKLVEEVSKFTTIKKKHNISRLLK